MGADSAGYVVMDPDTVAGAASDTSSVGTEPLFSLQQQTRTGETALHIAIRNNNVAAVKCLLGCSRKALGCVGDGGCATQGRGTGAGMCWHGMTPGLRQPS